MILTQFTNDSDLAQRADAAGVDRIGLDLERRGKHLRQDPAKCWISDHELSELPRIRDRLRHAQLFVRIEGWHEKSPEQIEHLIGEGVRCLMLPFFTELWQAERFIEVINGRADVSLLVESAASARILPELAQLPGVHDIHLGLNDLHRDLGMTSHFELLVSPLMSELCQQVRQAGRLLGFGGIGRYEDNGLHITPDLVYAQYAYHDAHSALVSRVFTLPDPDRVDMAHHVPLAKDRIAWWRSCSRQELEAARDRLRENVIAAGLGSAELVAAAQP